nr:MAG TPA: hypothetical protein [Caudoviricetes sp.]
MLCADIFRKGGGTRGGVRSADGFRPCEQAARKG